MGAVSLARQRRFGLFPRTSSARAARWHLPPAWRVAAFGRFAAADNPTSDTASDDVGQTEHCIGMITRRGACSPQLIWSIGYRVALGVGHLGSPCRGARVIRRRDSNDFLAAAKLATLAENVDTWSHVFTGYRDRRGQQ